MAIEFQEVPLRELTPRSAAVRIAALVFAVGVALTGCGEKPTSIATEAPSKTVSVVEITSRAIEGGLIASGSLVPREDTAVFSDLNGYRVAAVFVEEGVWVAGGQPLAQLDDTLLRSQIEQQAALVIQLEVQAERAEAEAARVKDFDGTSVFSQEQIDARRFAAKAARGGGSLEEIEELVRQAIPNTVTFGVFGTLEYLARGGRIGKGQAFLGTLLKINPILAIKMSEVVPVERVRTRSRAVERLCEIVRGLGALREMSVMRTTDAAEAEDVIRRLSSILPPERVYRASIGPSMGSQVGPRAVGVALIAEKPIRLSP